MIRPKAGYVAIKMDSLLKDKECGIFVPDSARVYKGRVGVVEDVSLYPEGQMYGIYDRKTGKLQSKPAWRWNDVYKDIKGKTVLIESGIGVTAGDEELCMCRLEYIVAVMPEGAEVGADNSGVRRCTRCKSSGEANMIMYHRSNGWFCPKCGKNDRGQTIEEVGDTVSRDVEESLGGENRRSKGTIFSFGK